MTSAAEGTQFPHPDSPAARAEADAEQDRQWAEEAEQARFDSIGIYRGIAHQHLRDAATQLRLADRAVKRLSESDLYDVEYEGNEVAYVNARALIDTGLAALAHLIPKPEAP
jgi:hypothetical protein